MPEIICVLGMHRSGTSLIARMLNLLGVSLGPEAHLAGSAEDNPKGFWENKLLVSINEEILSRWGGSWDEPPSFPEGWESSPKLSDLRQRVRAIIREDFAAAELWGWKDPRTCLTLPFWQKLLPPMQYVICLRNPVDVACSLKRRNNFSFEKGVELWLAYVAAALQHTRGQPRLFVFYEEIMEDWERELRRVAAFIGRLDLVKQEEIQRSIQEFIDEDLQHHRTSLVDVADEPKLAFEAKALYVTLRTYTAYQRRQTGACEAEELVLAAIDTFSPYAIEASKVRQRLEQEKKALTQQVQALQDQLAEREQQTSVQVQALQKQLAEREQQISAFQGQLAHLQLRLSWKRYRIADVLVAFYWHVRHPQRLWQLVKDRLWQLGRKWLPTAFKGWIKRVILRRSPPPWQPPQLLLSRKRGMEAAGFDPQQLLAKTGYYDVIVLPIIDWDFRFQRPQQIARQFAKHGYRVFYFSTDFGSGRRSEDPLLTVRPIEQNIAEVQLPSSGRLNVYRHVIDETSLQEWMRAFDQLRRDYGMAEAVCLVQLPFWRPLAFKLRDKFGWKVIYDCMDKHAGFSTNDPAMLKEEEMLSRNSDLILVTSRKLQEEQRRYSSSCLLAPNACEFEHFSISLGATPAELAALPRPIIGYYGAISEWFDTELVAEVARQRPDWSFVLIGDTFGAHLAPLQGLPNVHLLGEQPYQVLPAYLQAFDVCTIPFKLTPLTEATDPVKFYEYLSAGKPVVATPLPELEPYEAEGLVYLGYTSQEFVKRLEQALQENTAERATARQRFARQNTWGKRFSRIQRALRYLYGRISVIVITYNNLHMTKLCVKSIFRNTLWPNVELLIVDNASTDGTREYLQELAKEHENVKLILNDRNAGFARANNQGILAASGDYLVLLNNDTVVTRGWLGRLIRHLERDPKIGMVGPVTNAVGNEAKIDVSYASIEEMEDFAERRAQEYEGQAFEIKMLALFCTLIPRRVVDEVGLLDERFERGMFEDDDLALRVKRAGYKVVCAEDVFVHHFHSATFQQFGREAYLALLEKNRRIFEKKWGIKWEPHRYRGHHSR